MRYMVPQHINFTTGKDGGVLLDLSSGSMFTLNIVGGEIWRQICSGTDDCDIARSLADQFGITKDQAHADVRSLVGELREKQLVEAKPD